MNNLNEETTRQSEVKQQMKSYKFKETNSYPESKFQQDLRKTNVTFLEMIKDIFISIEESQGSTKLLFDYTSEIMTYKLIDSIRDLGILDHEGWDQESHFLTCSIGEGNVLVVNTACPARFYGQGKHENNILENINKILKEVEVGG